MILINSFLTFKINFKSKKDKINNEEKLVEDEILSTSFQYVNITDQPYASKNSKLNVKYRKKYLSFLNKQTRYSNPCK